MPIDYLSVLISLQDRFRDGIGTVDEDQPVPSCGNWTVRDLAEHLARAHHWAAAMARDQDASPLDRHSDALADHYATSAAELRQTPAELPPDAISRGLDGRNGGSTVPVAFWHRRQIHETLIHLHDLLGRLDGVEPRVWADAVDEVVTVICPRQVRLGRTPDPSPALRFSASDTDGTWVLGRGQVSATVSGTGEALALLLWGRTGIDRVDIAGDLETARDTLKGALTP